MAGVLGDIRAPADDGVIKGSVDDVIKPSSPMGKTNVTDLVAAQVDGEVAL